MKQKTFNPPRSLTRAFPQVRRVINATKPVVVEVRPRDCAEGKKFQTSECALAKATKRQFKADGVAIRMTDSFIVKGDTAIRFLTPETVKREIVSFDRHKDFAAGSYRLCATPPIWGRRNRSPNASTSGGRKPINKVVHHTARVRTVNSEENKRA